MKPKGGETARDRVSAQHGGPPSHDSLDPMHHRGVSPPGEHLGARRMSPAVGHGIGLRATHYDRWAAEPPAVDWAECITENFLDVGGRPRAVLERVRASIPVVFHGVSLSIGSVDPLDETYLQSVRDLADAVEPAWISDHLCWSSFGGQHLHDLLPLPYTEEALEHVVSRVARVQEALKRPFALENPSTS